MSARSFLGKRNLVTATAFETLPCAFRYLVSPQEEVILDGGRTLHDAAVFEYNEYEWPSEGGVGVEGFHVVAGFIGQAAKGH